MNGPYTNDSNNKQIIQYIINRKEKDKTNSFISKYIYIYIHTHNFNQTKKTSKEIWVAVVQ